MVDIVMITYNHERFIAQAIDSVLMQRTSFPIRLLIGEDCSTDGTRAVCRRYKERYPQIITLVENAENLGLVRNYKKIFDCCRGKYIAILEGDDYWTDPLKLQKQWDMLESDERTGLVHAEIRTLYEELGRMKGPVAEKIALCKRNQGDAYEALMRRNFICSLTVMFRRALFEETIDYQYFIDNEFQTIDYAVWLGLSLHSQIRYLNDVVGVYRVRAASISNSASIRSQVKFLNTLDKTVKYYLQRHPVEAMQPTDIEHKVNDILFANSLFSGNFESTRFYGGLIRKTTPMMKMKYLVSRSKAGVRLYSACAKMLFRLRLMSPGGSGPRSMRGATPAAAVQMEERQ